VLFITVNGETEEMPEGLVSDCVDHSSMQMRSSKISTTKNMHLIFFAGEFFEAPIAFIKAIVSVSSSIMRSDNLHG
jgi:hypothetical protein